MDSWARVWVETPTLSFGFAGCFFPPAFFSEVGNIVCFAVFVAACVVAEFGFALCCRSCAHQVLEAIATFPNICRQLHLPAQSGSTTVLVSVVCGLCGELKHGTNCIRSRSTGGVEESGSSSSLQDR